MTYYVSVTGLRLKSWFHFFQFTSFTVPAMKQAKAAKGNIFADGIYRDGVFHTLTVWENRSSMTRFMASGPHAKAMKITRHISYDTRVYGYEAEDIPSWDEARTIWHEKARVHGAPPRTNKHTHDGSHTTTMTTRMAVGGGTTWYGLNRVNLISIGLLLIATIAWTGYVPSQHVIS